MQGKQCQIEAKKHIVIVRKLRRVFVNRIPVAPAAELPASPPVVKRVIIHKKPIEVKPAMRIAVALQKPQPVQLPVAVEKRVGQPEPNKKQADRWSDCGQIYFTGGKAYGISPGLRTIFVGEQPSVESFLRTGDLDEGLTQTQREALRRIKEGKTLQLAASRS